jgi:hypothetical protein
MAPALVFFAAMLSYVLWLLAGLHWPALVIRRRLAPRQKVRLRLRVLFWVLIATVGCVLSAIYTDVDIGERFVSFLLGVLIAWAMAFGTFYCIEELLEIDNPHGKDNSPGS